MSENDGKMPWPVKVVWWWYLTLACASCVPLVICLVKGDPFGRGELFQLLAGTASLAAYFAGLALAVRRGRRGRGDFVDTLPNVCLYLRFGSVSALFGAIDTRKLDML